MKLMKTVEFTAEEVQLLLKLLDETDFGGNLQTLAVLVRVAQSAKEKLLTIDEPSSA